jgi:hypothetical protein
VFLRRHHVHIALDRRTAPQTVQIIAIETSGYVTVISTFAETAGCGRLVDKLL